jgi:hypothetical protein
MIRVRVILKILIIQLFFYDAKHTLVLYIRLNFQCLQIECFNYVYYLELLDRLRKRVMRVRMEVSDDWILRASSRQ